MKKLLFILLISIFLFSCKSMDVQEVSALNNVGVIGIMVSDVDDSQISQSGNFLKDMVQASVTSATSDIDILDGSNYTKQVHDSIFRQNFPFNLSKESIVLDSKAYEAIVDISSKEEKGLLAVTDIKNYGDYKSIFVDNIMANSSEAASAIAKETNLDGTLSVTVHPILVSQNLNPFSFNSLVSSVTGMAVKQVYVSVNVQFDLFNSEGKLISRYTANGYNKSELKSVNGVYNASAVNERLEDALDLAFVDYNNFYKEKGL